MQTTEVENVDIAPTAISYKNKVTASSVAKVM